MLSDSLRALGAGVEGAVISLTSVRRRKGRPTSGGVLADEVIAFVAVTGLAVFPMMPVPGERGRIRKVPLIRRWSKEATTDAGIIRLWAARWPWALWAAPVKGFNVLDFDRHGLMGRFLLDHRWPEPTTWIAGTPRGAHVYVRPIRGVVNSTGAIGPGIDLLARGRCVVLPLGEGARRLGYRWLRRLPEWTLERAPKRIRMEILGAGKEIVVERSGGHGFPARFRLPERIYEGIRDDTLFRFASSMRARGFEPEVILEQLMDVNSTLCRPPLPSREVEEKAAQVLKYKAGDRQGWGRSPWSGQPRRKRYRWKNGRYRYLPGPEGPQSARGHWANNKREADLSTVQCPYLLRDLSHRILRILRAWKRSNYWGVRLSYPELGRALAVEGVTASPRSMYRALILLDTLELIALPPGHARQVQSWHEHSYMVGVSDPPSAGSRFVDMVRGDLP